MQKIKELILQYLQNKKKNQIKTSDKPRVIVCSRNYSTNLSVARALGENGYEVEILRIFHNQTSNLKRLIIPEAYSKYVKAFYSCNVTESYDMVKKLLDIADSSQKKLFIPVDDLAASIADLYYDELKAFFYLPSINQTSGEITRLMCKERQKQIARQVGIPVINGVVIKVANGCFEIPNTVTYPCFVKPNTSKNASKDLIKRCNDEAALRRFLESVRNKDLDFLVEDFISIHKEYGILGLSTNSGIIAPGFFEKNVCGHKERFGVPLQGKTIISPKLKHIAEQLIHYIELTGFEGLFDVDLVESDEGIVYFVELNLRTGASGYAITKSGVNLPGMYADYVYFHSPIDMDCEMSSPGKTFLSERVLLDEYRNGYISCSKVKTYMKNTDIFFMKNKEDMRSYRFFRLFFIVAVFERFFRK